MLLVFEQEGKLSTHCGLTCTIKTSHEDDCRTIGEVEFCSLTTHQFCQLIVNNLHHQLAWFNSCEHVLS